jgi:hypothetical protein
MKKTAGDYVGTDNIYNYKANVCGEDIFGQTHGCNGGSICQFNPDDTFVANLGKFDGGQPTWSPIDTANPSKGVKYTFTNGDQCYIQGSWRTRTVNANFRCDQPKQADKIASVLEDTTSCTFQINFDGYGCPGGDSKNPDGSTGMSGGWVFIIILCVAVPVYVIGGCVYKSQKQGTRGIESCPNIDFWKALPGLVKDGFSYTFNMIRSGCKSGGGNYETV